MSYRWHSKGKALSMLQDSLAIGTKRRKVEKKKKNKNKVHTKRKLQIRFYNNKRKEENLTPVSLSAQTLFSFSYETLISSDLHSSKLKIA